MKMKRMAAVLLLLLSLAFLFACERGGTDVPSGTTDTASLDTGALLSATGFANVDGTLTLTVPNATAEFSFADRFTVTQGASWRVVQGEWNDAVSLAVTVCPLNEGDNRFTLGVLSDGGVSLYPIVIRRRPLYTVTFNANGGSATAPMQVEEGTVLTPPADPVRTGYTFAGWDLDLTRPVTAALTVSATWTPNPNTPYTVEYYLENAAGTGYDSETVSATGATDATVIAVQKTYPHFTFDPTASVVRGTVLPDGSLTLKLYYTRDVYTVSFLGNGGTVSGGNATQRVRYGNPAVLPSVARKGYSFAGWDHADDCTAVAGDLTVTAQWTAKTYSVTYDPDGGTLGGTAPATYTPEDDVALTVPTRSLYEFAGWYSQNGDRVDNFAGHYGNLTLTARWTPCLTVSETGEITGITSVFRASAIEIVVPSDYEGVSVTSIGEGAFSGCPLLSSVTISEEIVSIGEGAFANCPALLEVEWNAVACHTAGEESTVSVFAGCSALESVSFGENVTLIPDYAFYNCPSLSSVAFGGGIVTVGDCAFYGCSSLSAVLLREGVTSIGTQAFAQCGDLASVFLPDSLLTVGRGAFEGCAKLTSITFGKNIFSIGADAFRSSGLTLATFFSGGEWYVTETEGALSGSDVSVDDPATAASYLKNAYCPFYWYKK